MLISHAGVACVTMPHPFVTLGELCNLLCVRPPGPLVDSIGFCSFFVLGLTLICVYLINRGLYIMLIYSILTFLSVVGLKSCNCVYVPQQGIPCEPATLITLANYCKGDKVP